MDAYPSLPLPTFGGKQFWGDVFLYAGYRIQQNVFTRHFRLLGPTRFAPSGDARLAVGSYEHCHATFHRLKAAKDIRPASDHAVLLLHGIFRSKDSFGPMTRRLCAEGFDAHAVNYPSTRQTLEEHADQVEQVLERLEDTREVSFVTHSMGGIVARVLLGRQGRPWRDRIRVNRLVMIATPNRGSELATRLDALPVTRTVAGPSLGQMALDRVDRIPLPTVPFGVVAASRGDPRGYNPLLPGDDDGIVSVESTHLPGYEDALVVTGIHTFVMIQPSVVDATIRYLRTGSFSERPAIQ